MNKHEFSACDSHNISRWNTSHERVGDKFPDSVLVYSKSEYTSRIGLYVRPSGRLHDNFRKESRIVMKFSTQFSLINISVKFEDEPDWTSPSWIIAKILIFSYAFL